MLREKLKAMTANLTMLDVIVPGFIVAWAASDCIVLSGQIEQQALETRAKADLEAEGYRPLAITPDDGALKLCPEGTQSAFNAIVANRKKIVEEFVACGAPKWVKTVLKPITPER